MTTSPAIENRRRYHRTIVLPVAFAVVCCAVLTAIAFALVDTSGRRASEPMPMHAALPLPPATADAHDAKVGGAGNADPATAGGTAPMATAADAASSAAAEPADGEFLVAVDPAEALIGDGLAVRTSN